jgi:hypothetical protein
MTQTQEPITQIKYKPSIIEAGIEQIQGGNSDLENIDVPDETIFAILDARRKFSNDDALSVETRIFGLDTEDRNYVLNAPTQPREVSVNAYFIKSVLASRKNLE